MKKPSSKQPRTVKTPQVAQILQSLRNARRQAVKIARQHGTAIIYVKNGKLIKERP